MEIINIGITADDGTGDPIRAAFDKCNSNFQEVLEIGAGLVPGALTVEFGEMVAIQSKLSAYKFVPGDYATLEIARTDGGAIGKTVIVASVLSEAQSNITAAWPTDRALKVEKGGSIGNTTTFTINGPFSAGDYQVFAGSGAVTALKEARPEWFGTNTIPGTTDMTTAIQKAIDSAVSSWDPATYASSSPSGVPTVKFKSELYSSSALTISKSILLEGSGPTEFSAGTRIWSAETTSAALITVDPIAQGCSFQMRDLTVRGTGTGTGILLNIKNTISSVNSVRINNVVFGTPDSHAIAITGSDDVLIDGVLFDVAATSAILLDTVSNVSIINSNFFAVNLGSIYLKDVDGVNISNNRAYTAYSSTFSDVFVDARQTLPTYTKNVHISNNILKNYNTLASVDNSANLKISGNTLTRASKNDAATQSIIDIVGTTSGLDITGNTITSGVQSGHFFIRTNNATITDDYYVNGNTFANLSSAAGKAIGLSSYVRYPSNIFIGFSDSYASQPATSATISAGVLTALSNYTTTVTHIGAKQGKTVTISSPDTVWIVPDGIVVTAYVSAPDTVTIRYVNVTAGAIGVPDHTVFVLVSN